MFTCYVVRQAIPVKHTGVLILFLLYAFFLCLLLSLLLYPLLFLQEELRGSGRRQVNQAAIRVDQSTERQVRQTDGHCHWWRDGVS